LRRKAGDAGHGDGLVNVVVDVGSGIVGDTILILSPSTGHSGIRAVADDDVALVVLDVGEGSTDEGAVNSAVVGGIQSIPLVNQAVGGVVAGATKMLSMLKASVCLARPSAISMVSAGAGANSVKPSGYDSRHL
jgi:hypothetical protein